jgi:hypothetical protein
LLLTLLRLELLLCDLSLLLEELLSLNGRKKVLGFEEFGVIGADTLLLHLLVFLIKCQSYIIEGTIPKDN